MAIYVNTEPRLTYDDIARRLVQMHEHRLAAALRELEADAAKQSRRYSDLLAEWTAMQQRLHPAKQASEPVSYKPSPLSDG